MLSLKCDSCKSRNKIQTSFWISKIDAIGFIFLSILLTGPVWAITSLIEEFGPISFLIVCVSFYLAVSNQQYKIVALLVIEFFIDSLFIELELYSYSILVATAFLLTFAKVGSKIYGFFFLCVNYKFNFKLICSNCGRIHKSIALPKVA